MVGTAVIEPLELAHLQFLLLLFVFYAVLGCLIYSISMIVITIPLLYPVVRLYSIDRIWFGHLKRRAPVGHQSTYAHG